MRDRDRWRAALLAVRRFYRDLRRGVSLRDLHARSVRPRPGERARAWAETGEGEEEEKPFLRRSPLSPPLPSPGGLTYLLSPLPSRSRG